MKQTTTTKNDYQPGNQLQRPKNNFGFLYKKNQTKKIRFFFSPSLSLSLSLPRDSNN